MSPSFLRLPSRGPLGAVLLVAAVVSGCSALRGSPPEPTPMDFPGIAGQLALAGVQVGSPISGDAGCSDASLIPTAIGFDAAGLDEPKAVRLRIYIFRNRETYERRRADVDACVATWAANPADVEFVDASPFVVAVQGPIGDRFESALRTALAVAAGNGG